MDHWIQYQAGARTLGARSRGSKTVTYRQQTTDKKVNTKPIQLERPNRRYDVMLGGVN